jgi:hypothetical protein
MPILVLFQAKYRPRKEKMDNDDIMQQSYIEFILCLALVPSFPPGHRQELLQRGHALSRQLFLQGGHLFVWQLRVLLLLL